MRTRSVIIDRRSVIIDREQGADSGIGIVHHTGDIPE